MSGLIIFLTALYFTLLGVAWVKGYDIVKKRAPEQLPKFYLILATIRFILTSTLVLCFVLLSDDMALSRQFALMVIAMYVVMMVVTLALKH